MHRQVRAHVIPHRLRAEPRVLLLILEHEAVVVAEVERVVAGLPFMRRVGRLELLHDEHRHRQQVEVEVRLGPRQPVDRRALGHLQRAEVVIEAAVLHHQHDDVIDAREQLLGRQVAGRRALVDRRTRGCVTRRGAVTGGPVDRRGAVAAARAAVATHAAGRRLATTARAAVTAPTTRRRRRPATATTRSGGPTSVLAPGRVVPTAERGGAEKGAHRLQGPPT